MSGFIRAAAVSPELFLGNVKKNQIAIEKTAFEAVSRGAKLIVFPEMCLTGYTIGDLVDQDFILEQALHGLKNVLCSTKNLEALIVVGLPLVVDSVKYNVAAVMEKGKLLGIVPKIYLPSYKEFQDERWYAEGPWDVQNISLPCCSDKPVPFGARQLFESGDFVLGVEICEDLWAPIPPSSFHALAGATVIANLSASNELVGKADYRRQLISTHSGQIISGYVYASAGAGESTTDLVFRGHCIVAENGKIIKESENFPNVTECRQIVLADLDLDACIHDRIGNGTFSKAKRIANLPPYRRTAVQGCYIEQTPMKLCRSVPLFPFLPSNSAEREKVCRTVFDIQVTGLARRLEGSGIENIVLGLSGGRDSVLAFLVALRTLERLRLPSSNLSVISMPGPGTSKKTKSCAANIARSTGASFTEQPIHELVKDYLPMIGHDGSTQNVVFENAQARARTYLLMGKANLLSAIVLGTGDLSEIAVGWCTFNGDHISMYNVNLGVPKTLIEYVIKYEADTTQNSDLSKALKECLSLEISPELLKNKGKAITQKTEDFIGPYPILEFYLYQMVRWGSKPEKMMYLLGQAIDQYSGTLISKKKLALWRDNSTRRKWLKSFIRRFFGAQWKRSVSSDGPKVGSVSLSPRGDWRMPSDIGWEPWLENI